MVYRIKLRHNGHSICKREEDILIYFLIRSPVSKYLLLSLSNNRLIHNKPIANQNQEVCRLNTRK